MQSTRGEYKLFSKTKKIATLIDKLVNQKTHDQRKATCAGVLLPYIVSPTSSFSTFTFTDTYLPLTMTMMIGFSFETNVINIIIRPHIKQTPWLVLLILTLITYLVLSLQLIKTEVIVIVATDVILRLCIVPMCPLLTWPKQSKKKKSRCVALTENQPSDTKPHTLSTDSHFTTLPVVGRVCCD